jgi:hypothetical protein
VVLGVVKEGSPTIATLRYREAVEQVVGQDAAIGGLPRANVDLSDARRIVGVACRIVSVSMDGA